MRTSRFRFMIAGLAALTIAAVAAIVNASSSGVSTSQAIANAKPPPSGPTTATVERRPLAQSISVRGVIAAPNTVELRAPQNAREDVTNVLTALPVTEGASIGPRTVIAEMSGRPIILLSGERPFYRDLRFEDTGPDVSSLQRALGVAETGTFDVKTQTALADLYTSVGYTAPIGEAGDAGAGSESQAPDEVLQPLRDALEDAQIDGQASIDAATLDFEAAKDALADGSGTQADVDASQRALEQAGRTRDRSVARARRDLDAASRRATQEALANGPYLSRAEILVGSAEQLTVVSLPLAIGFEPQAGDLIAVLGDRTLEGVAYVSPVDAKDLRPGLPASVTGVELGGELGATVIDVVREAPSTGAGEAEGAPAAPTGSQATTEFPMKVRFAFAEQPPTTLLGASALMTIEVQGTDSTVLAVPLVALQRVGGDDVVVTVDNKKWVVETGLAAEGWVELKAGSPPEGSRVVTR